MSTIKKVLSKIHSPKSSSPSETPTTTSPRGSLHEHTLTSPISSIINGHIGRALSKHSKDPSKDSKARSKSRSESHTRSQSHTRSKSLPRPSNGVYPAEDESGSSGGKRARRMSFTELKVERKAEREELNEAEARARAERHRKLREEDPLKDNYGDLPLNMSQTRSERRLDSVKSIADKKPGEKVAFRARVHHIRALGSKIVFLILRHQITTLQCILTEQPNHISQNMVRWAEGITRESIVIVEGTVKRPPEDQEVVRSTSVRLVEVLVEKLFVVAAPSAPLPFQVDDISHPHEHNTHRVGDRTRLSNRVLDLRSPTSQAIFRLRSATCQLFRTYLLSQNFTEIQSSKFQEGGTESGAAVFKVDYFRRTAFLAQSPQLAKQMCVAADLERVFEVGPVFRAENSNTHRHLTEFTGLDLEMAFENHYEEVLDVIDEMFLTIFRGLQRDYRDEIEIIKRQYPHEDLVFPDKTVRLLYSDGIKMLQEAGYREEDGSEITDEDDLSTAAERMLGRLVKERFGTDYYILNKFPTKVRPFYTMPDPENPKFSNSFDIFIRGEEVLSGGQRIHDAPMLEKRMRECKVDPSTMRDYVNGFRWGCPPHGGGGVGLERVIMLFLKLGDVRWASLIPRDPRSFPMNGQDLAEASMAKAAAMILHGPESKTFSPGEPRGDLPPLENLIAKYGDATNTSWVDPAWTVWRDQATGAAVGYIPMNGFAVIFGNPLCEPKQLPRVIRAFLSYITSDPHNLKPVWCCVSRETEKYLADELGWSAVIAVAEERVNPTEVDPASQDKTVRRKIHRAEREGVKVHEVDGVPDSELRERIEERCKEWSANRKGTQVHLTGVRPFDDAVHRKYFYATDKDGKICALVVLAQLAPIHGFQIKWALEFPGAPLGAIEYILSFVIKKLGDAGVRTATFGAGATGTLQPVENIGGFKVRTLEKTYNGISHTFHLTGKGDFRHKFGVEQDPLYICYPKGGLGLKGIEAIMQALQMPK
ncbi:aspartyl-tRNA synthetase, cytoplasmic [Panus rudis PR-1116 ss-1]|nr:aspartyl-tRNA synthetase, cytoplasmic [Panus rudis PR-1116 ss-1]